VIAAMRRPWLFCVLALGSIEACGAAAPRASNLTEQQILSGEALPWPVPSSSTLVTEDEAFGIDAEMRAFVAPLAAVAEPDERLLRLREAMESYGLFSMDYRNEFTRTARTAFHEHQGNCLSFTMLFVALAREAGLDSSYNVVDVPPTFDSKGGQVVVGRHVNALVRTAADRQFIVDFNEPNYRETYPIRPVSDRYALALFYSNLGAEALVRRQYESSFALLRKATSVASDVPGAWVNLAVLYSRLGRYDYAEAADLRALAADPMDESALVNLISVYSSLGERGLAAFYRQRTRAYRNANPYYHFALAQTAYDQKRYKDALSALRSAIRLKPDEEFYRLQGRAFVALGRRDRATESFERAAATATPR
jgi:tetratricopeptide (TPR) repeat protein